MERVLPNIKALPIVGCTLKQSATNSEYIDPHPLYIMIPGDDQAGYCSCLSYLSRVYNPLGLPQHWVGLYAADNITVNTFFYMLWPRIAHTCIYIEGGCLWLPNLSFNDSTSFCLRCMTCLIERIYKMNRTWCGLTIICQSNTSHSATVYWLYTRLRWRLYE